MVVDLTGTFVKVVFRLCIVGGEFDIGENLKVEEMSRLFVDVTLWNKVLNDLRSYEGFLEICGEEQGICTRKKTNNARANDDGDYGDRNKWRWKTRRLNQSGVKQAPLNHQEHI